MGGKGGEGMSLRVSNLCKSYGGTPVLKAVSFTAERGVTCIMGPSGKGKTTLLRILLGLERRAPWSHGYCSCP